MVKSDLTTFGDGLVIAFESERCRVHEGPRAWMTLTLRRFAKLAKPPVRVEMTLFFRSRTLSISIAGLPLYSTPQFSRKSSTS